MRIVHQPSIINQQRNSRAYPFRPSGTSGTMSFPPPQNNVNPNGKIITILINYNKVLYNQLIISAKAAQPVTTRSQAGIFISQPQSTLAQERPTPTQIQSSSGHGRPTMAQAGQTPASAGPPSWTQEGPSLVQAIPTVTETLSSSERAQLPTIRPGHFPARSTQFFVQP